MAVTYLGKAYCDCSPIKSGLTQSKLYGSKPDVIMGVNTSVTPPAQTTETQIDKPMNINSNTKIFPYDFTSQDRKFKTFKLVSRVRDIMNAINGPKIMDINIAKSNDVNVVRSHDGTRQFPPTNHLSGSLSGGTHYLGFSNNFTLIQQPKLYVRRDGENANAMTAIDYVTANYDEQASRITSNAPSDSMYSYPFVFSNYTLDPAIRPLCVDPIIKWVWSVYTATSTPPQVSVLKLSTLNSNIQSSTIFPGALTPFPANAVAIDCSTLSSTTIGKLYKLSPYIIDVSNSQEGLFNAVSSTEYDTDIALALDHTYSSQDIEFALFLSNMYYPIHTTGTSNTIQFHTYKYDPVEAVFSYFSTKKYEFTGNTLYDMSTNASFGQNLMLSNKYALTYLIQQAAKQMKIWMSPSISLAKGIYTGAQLTNALAFNSNVDFSFSSNSIYVYWPSWIPYEYVKTSNNNIELDKTIWISGRGNRKVAKHAVKPASYLDQAGTNTTTYYNKFGEAFSFVGNQTNVRPISIYVPNLPDRCIYTSQAWNDDTLCNYDYLEESDYFPVQNLEFDI